MVNQKTRFDVFKRENFTCQYCGRRAPDVILEIDHVLPRSKRGTDNRYNLVTACRDCNRGKSDSKVASNVEYFFEHFNQYDSEYNNLLAAIDQLAHNSYEIPPLFIQKLKNIKIKQIQYAIEFFSHRAKPPIDLDLFIIQNFTTELSTLQGLSDLDDIRSFHLHLFSGDE